ncbi:MAG: TraR/DksA C4-type zinc finger protein [Candidatus Staskawiczbacteria bacterium]|jgi:DnaK suppressor protein
MNEKSIKELKEKLEREKQSLEGELKKFAKEDSDPKRGWNTRYPKFDGVDMEEEADEMQEYENLLPVEHSLELRLRDVNSALEKIETNKYGNCEKCGEQIAEDRLQACPEAKLCGKCK